MSEAVQHGLVGLIVAAAALYLVRHLTGWPRLRAQKPKPQRAVLGERLAKGLEKAERRAR